MPPRLAALLFSLALLLVPGTVAAHDFPCDGAKLSWLRAAATATALRVEPVACYLVATRVRLLPDGSPPIDVAIEEPPGAAFARAGRLRVSPIVEIDDYQKLPAPQRAAFEKLLAWLREHHDEVVFGRSFERTGGPRRFLGLDAPLLLLAGVLVALLAWPPKVRIRGREVLAVVALTVCALAVRLALGVWAPHQVNGHGVLWIRSLCSGADGIAGYGPGYFEIFPRAICHQSWPPDTIVFAVDAMFTATVPALLYAMARRLGATPRAALVVGAAAMLDPVSIRFAATESYLALAVPLLLLATLLFTVGARLAIENQHVRAALWVLAAGLVGAQLARVHPVSWMPLALVPAMVFAVGDRTVSIPRRIVLMAIGAAIVGGAVLATSYAAIRASLHLALGQDYVRTNTDGSTVFVLGVGVLVFIVLTVRRLPVLVPATIYVAVMLASHGAYGQAPLWRMSYDRLFLGVPLVTMATLVPARVPGQGRKFLAVMVATLALVVAPRWSILVGRTGQQVEYRWLRTALSAAPPGCRIAYPEWDQHAVELPEYATPAGREGRLEAVPITSADEIDGLLRDGQCLWFAHTTACGHPDRRALCDEIEQRGAYTPAATTSVPAVEQYNGEFTRETRSVTVGVGRLHAQER